MDFSHISDDYYINLNLQTTLALPTSRETVLHFCEAVQKEFHEMSTFYQRESGEFVLEADRESGTYPWLELQSRRLTAGYFNPDSSEDAYRLHRWLLERSVYFLGMGGLDVEALDVLYGFNLDCRGNRDAVVSQALLAGSPLASMIAETGAAIEFEPNIVMALDEGCYGQCRLSMETRGNSYQVRTGQYDDEPISVYFTVRQHPRPGEVMDILTTFGQLCRQGEKLIRRVIVPNVIEPISAAIASL